MVSVFTDDIYNFDLSEIFPYMEEKDFGDKCKTMKFKFEDMGVLDLFSDQDKSDSQWSGMYDIITTVISKTIVKFFESVEYNSNYMYKEVSTLIKDYDNHDFSHIMSRIENRKYCIFGSNVISMFYKIWAEKNYKSYKDRYNVLCSTYIEEVSGRAVTEGFLIDDIQFYINMWGNVVGGETLMCDKVEYQFDLLGIDFKPNIKGGKDLYIKYKYYFNIINPYVIFYDLNSTQKEIYTKFNRENTLKNILE